jgi:RNA polymerase primary sigma factor
MSALRPDPWEPVPSYVTRLTQAPLLSADEETQLTLAARAGCPDARKRLIESNMRLVVNIAKTFSNPAVTLEDLVQEGAIGLVRAVERFDPDRGYRFSTYATHWIRQAISRAVNGKSKAIRLPAHVWQTLRRIDKARQDATQRLGREPSIEELASLVGMTPRRVRALAQSSQEMLSLDVAVGETGNTLGSLIPDLQATDPEDAALDAEALEELETFLSELSERERRIVSVRIRCSETDLPVRREELGKELSMSRERVRQIEVQALKKLRRLARQRHGWAGA